LARFGCVPIGKNLGGAPGDKRAVAAHRTLLARPPEPERPKSRLARLRLIATHDAAFHQ
jgi:hypothetical protein